MKPIQMVDLVSQYTELEPEIEQEFRAILRSASFIQGAQVRAFEAALAAYLGEGVHVVSCANGTDALQIPMMAWGLAPGDEVILPNFTYIATAEVVRLLRLTPVYVDVDPDTFNVSVAAVERALTPRTRAVVPVHLFGQCADMEGLLALARKHGFLILEDTAQAIGARCHTGEPNGMMAAAGTLGHAGSTSFYPSKNLSCYGDGGAMFTRDEALAAELRAIANHGQSRRYYFDRVGVNSRLDTLQAAVLLAKLKRLGAYTQARQAAAAAYDDALAPLNRYLTRPFRSTSSTHVFHQYTIRVHDGKRDALQAHLAARNIPSVVFYPLPVHRQTAYEEPHWQDEDFPVSTRLCTEVLSLPMHTELEAEQIAYITDAIAQFFGQ
jgi:dTDP-4-amino-4,6-dideoxygalactose transaminase